MERTNRTLTNLLKASPHEQHPGDWDRHIGRALMAYRATVHTSTGFSPHRMTTGHKMRIPCDIYLPYKPKLVRDPSDFVASMSEDIKPIHELAHKSPEKAYYDWNASPHGYNVGDFMQV